MTTRTRDLLETIRENTFAATPADEMLDFYPAARALGLSDAEAEEADEVLTTRVMRARGAL